MEKPKALITGISGQDGSYLAELLLEEGYEVHGIIRRHSDASTQTSRIDHLRETVQLHYGDLTDFYALCNLIKTIRPEHIYNFAAQSHVKISFEMPIYTMEANTLGLLSILEAVKIIDPTIKIYQASSSEMFGNNVDPDGYQRITTTMVPVSPYGCSKLASHYLAHNYRNSYGMFVVSAVLFNHESPRRGENFVTAKVCKTAARIKLGKDTFLKLGNLDAYRDWGHAKDYVRAIYMMMNNDQPKDYVVSTGESHSVKDLCVKAFSYLGMDYKDYVKTDQKFFRPEELEFLKGDSSAIREELGWKPQYDFDTLIEEMVDYWMEREKNDN